MTNLFIIIGISLTLGVIIGLIIYYFVGKKGDCINTCNDPCKEPCKDINIVGTYPLTFVGTMASIDPDKNTFGTTNSYIADKKYSFAFVVTGTIEKSVKTGYIIKMIRKSPEPQEYIFIIRQIVEPNDYVKGTTIMFDVLNAVLDIENNEWDFVVRKN
jgi:hypothetical protein